MLNKYVQSIAIREIKQLKQTAWNRIYVNEAGILAGAGVDQEGSAQSEKRLTLSLAMSNPGNGFEARLLGLIMKNESTQTIAESKTSFLVFVQRPQVETPLEVIASPSWGDVPSGGTGPLETQVERFEDAKQIPFLNTLYENHPPSRAYRERIEMHMDLIVISMHEYARLQHELENMEIEYEQATTNLIQNLRLIIKFFGWLVMLLILGFFFLIRG